VALLGGEGSPPAFRHGQPLVLEIQCRADSPRLGLHVGVGLDRADGVQVTAVATHLDHLPPLCGAREYRLRLLLPRLPLVKGEYALHAFLLDEKGLHVYDEWVAPAAFEVRSDRYRFGLVEVEHEWDLPVCDGEIEPLAETGAAGAETWAEALRVGISSGRHP
jgi:hypothetical protein